MTINGVLCGIITLVTLLVLIVALLSSVIPIGVNSVRINDLLQSEASIQNIAIKIAKEPSGSNSQELQSELNTLNKKRDYFRKLINFGDSNYYNPPQFECVPPMKATCFLKNSSEHNNLYIALASGTLGACLFILSMIRRRYNDDAIHNSSPQTNIMLEIICLLPTGAVLGLMSLYLLRGTKGDLLSPISDVVQIDNPYGVAFACTIFGFLSDRILILLMAIVEKLTSVSRI